MLNQCEQQAEGLLAEPNSGSALSKLTSFDVELVHAKPARRHQLSFHSLPREENRNIDETRSAIIVRTVGEESCSTRDPPGVFHVSPGGAPLALSPPRRLRGQWRSACQRNRSRRPSCSYTAHGTV